MSYPSVLCLVLCLSFNLEGWVNPPMNIILLSVTDGTSIEFYLTVDTDFLLFLLMVITNLVLLFFYYIECSVIDGNNDNLTFFCPSSIKRIAKAIIVQYKVFV